MKITDIIPEGHIAKWRGSPIEIKEVDNGVDFIIHFRTMEEVYIFIKATTSKYEKSILS